MNLKRAGLILLSSAVATTGCGMSDSSPATPGAPVTPSAVMVTRVHWIGKQQLLSQTNAARLLSIWNAPDTLKLETQTLDKLARAPWMLPDRKLDTNAGARLRLLLDDLVRQESYLEIRQTGDQPAQIALAVRLNDQRAALWETNLAAVLESLTGIRPSARAGQGGGWSLKKHHEPNLIELTRAGDWTIVGAAQDQNALLGDMVSRVERSRAPFGSEVAHDWFQAAADLPRFLSLFTSDRRVNGNWPKISIAVAGEGTNLHTRGEFTFAILPPIDLDRWNLPISIMDGPQASFAAVRGFKVWLSSLKAWNDLQIGPPPNQLYFWAMMGRGMDSFGAAPLADASNAVSKLADRVMQRLGPWIATNELVKFRKAETFNGLEWQGDPWLWPSLKSLSLTNGNFVFGELFQNQPMSPPPPDYFDNVLGEPNLLYYQRELTDARTPQWLYIGQFARFVSLRPQMPFQCAALNCLKAIGPKLGVSTTRITKTGPNQLSFDRTSTVGFTGLELHLLADWLESPRFPLGFHTLSVTPQNK